MSSVVAKRYAKALHSLGKASGSLEALVGEVEQLATLYAGSSELRGALENPSVSHPSRKAILTEIATRLALSPTAKNALLFIADRRRLGILSSIAQRLREITDLDNGVVRAEVVSAAPLDATYLSHLKEQLEAISGKRVTLDCRQDPALIAGVVTRIGDTIYDGSLKTRLESLKLALMPN